MNRRAPGNPNICKAQAHNLNLNISIAQAPPWFGSPSQAELKTVQDHQPIGELFRRVLGTSGQRAYPDEARVRRSPSRLVKERCS